MNNQLNNPYFKFLKRDSRTILIIFVVIITLNLGGSVVSDTIMALNETSTEPIRIMTQVAQMGMFICFFHGLLSIIKTFTGAISIRGDRVGFLKALVLWSMVISIFIAVISVLFEIGSKILIESITNREVYLISDVVWVSLDDIEMKVAEISLMWFVKSIMTRTLTNLVMISVGYMIGAITYRLKIKYNILIFVIIPIILVGYIVNKAFNDNEIVFKFIMNIITMVMYIIEKPIIYAIIQVAIIGVCTLVGTKLIVKAPTKDYAHDLI